MKDDHNIITLENGIRLVHRQIQHSEIVHCGYMINVGSRDENLVNNGVAHFIEHTVFKGTDRRKAHHILRRIESVGGELNAYTTREKTCYYASGLKQYAERAIDLLTDITFNSVFPEKEIEKEKKVILEEIDMYDDSPEESIYDDFYALIFKDHPLGFNILGTKATVNELNRRTIQDFIFDHYVADKLILSVVGDVTLKQAERMAHKFMDKVSIPGSNNLQRLFPEIQPSFHKTYTKDFAQTHCIIGSRAYGRHDEKRFALSLINNILGGAGMSSKLNMAVREKHGLTYHIASHYSGYEDTGIFSIYFACDSKNLNRCRDIINRELRKMRDIRLSEKQLQQVKLQFLGQMAMVVENNSVHMQHQARSLLDFSYVQSFKEYMESVEKVTTGDILEVANDVLNPGNLSSLVYEDEK
ncbi:MAG: M16 family metallopeptidase [Bacteroidia bacterium]